MRLKRLLRTGFAVGFAPLILSCTVYEIKEDYPQGVSVPEAFSVESRAGRIEDPWWEALGDPELNRIIEGVLDANPVLMQSWARLRQSEALARQARSRLYPEVTVEAGAARNRSTIFSRGQLGDQDVTTNIFNLSLGAGYEVDLWRRMENQSEAAALNALATREDLEAAAMSLAGTTAELWYAMAEQRAQQALLAEQMEIGKTFLKLLELRFSLGQSTALDLYQQRQQLAATRSQVPLVEAQLAVMGNQLAVLMGVPPQEFAAGPRDELPELPSLPDPGLPAELLSSRPDVRAVYLRIRAADHGVGAAVADLLPALRLGGSGGFQGTKLVEIFDSFIYQIFANLSAPVYDHDRRREEVKRKKEILEERLQQYRQVILQAFREVEDALAREDRQHVYIEELGKQMEIARNTLAQARFRYGNGLSDYLPVLTALQALQNLERNYLNARRQLVAYRIQLYSALGGSWTDRIEPPHAISLKTPPGE